jgi:hypothetical protein
MRVSIYIYIYIYISVLATIFCVRTLDLCNSYMFWEDMVKRRKKEVWQYEIVLTFRQNMEERHINYEIMPLPTLTGQNPKRTPKSRHQIFAYTVIALHMLWLNLSEPSSNSHLTWACAWRLRALTHKLILHECMSTCLCMTAQIKIAIGILQHRFK